VRTCLECLPCLVRQALEGARHATKDNAIHEHAVRTIMHQLGEGDLIPIYIQIGITRRTRRSRFRSMREARKRWSRAC
jgi:uncharacterized protein with ATP-grasp and redox domains